MSTSSKPLPGAEAEGIYGILGFWVEALLYGAYLSIFIHANRVMTKRWRQTSKIFFVGIWIMFIMTTIITAFLSHQMVHAFAMLREGETTSKVLAAFNSWDMYGRILLINILVWVADVLVMYRAYIIWGRNRYILILPIAIMLTSMGIGFYHFYWWAHPSKTYLTPVALKLLRLVFPLSLAQNLITTSLIVAKIWQQHRQSHSSGLLDKRTTPISLMSVVSVVIESAAMYTLLMLALSIQTFSRHRFGLILQCAVAPVTSMIFVLLSVRMEDVRSRGRDRSVVVNSLFPTAPVHFAQPRTNSTLDDSIGTHSMALTDTKDKFDRMSKDDHSHKGLGATALGSMAV